LNDHTVLFMNQINSHVLTACKEIEKRRINNSMLQREINISYT